MMKRLKISVVGNALKLEFLSYFAGGDMKRYISLEESLAVLQNVEHKVTIV